jgi:hypothetical protein
MILVARRGSHSGWRSHSGRLDAGTAGTVWCGNGSRSGSLHRSLVCQRPLADLGQGPQRFFLYGELTMTESSESQGLKIAVSSLITLTVILGVACYFLFAELSSVRARLAAARDHQVKAEHSARLALTQYDEMRRLVGTKAEEPDASIKEIIAELKRIEERSDKAINEIHAAVETAKQNGAQGAELEEAERQVQQILAAYHSDPNKSLMSSLDRLAEVLAKLSVVTSQLSLKHVGVTKQLEGDKGSAKGK